MYSASVEQFSKEENKTAQRPY